MIGGVLGASVNPFLQAWRVNRDDLSGRIDELCSAVVAAGTLGTEYWATPFDKSKLLEQKIYEAKLGGAQALVDGLYSDLRAFLREGDRLSLDVALSEFVGIITGGGFTVAGRPIDEGRIFSSAEIASAIVVFVRHSHRRTLPFGWMFALWRRWRDFWDRDFRFRPRSNS